MYGSEEKKMTEEPSIRWGEIYTVMACWRFGTPTAAVRGVDDTVGHHDD